MGNKDDSSHAISDNEATKSQQNELFVSDRQGDAFDDLPEEEKHLAVSFMRMSMESVSPQLELSRKMTSEHITEFLQGQREASNNGFKERRETRIWVGIILLLVMIFIISLIIILKNDPNTMKEILAAIIGLVAGAIGGYGYGKQKTDE